MPCITAIAQLVGAMKVRGCLVFSQIEMAADEGQRVAGSNDLACVLEGERASYCRVGNMHAALRRGGACA